MASRRVVLADLPLSEKERFYEFLVANKVQFIADPSGETFSATIRVVPPETSTAMITGRAKAATKQTVRRGDSSPTKAHASRPPLASPDAAVTLKAAQSMLRRHYPRFCNLLPTLQQPPKGVKRAFLLRFAEEVYDARYEKDSQCIKNEANGAAAKHPQNFPEFVYEFATKRYGLKALVSRNCWGMISSLELNKSQHVAVDIFGKFIEETYDATDLLFFLFTRSAVARVVAQTTKKPDQDNAKDMAKAKAKPKQKIVTSDVIQLSLAQVVQVVKMSIDVKRVELRERVLKQLDLAMAARKEGFSRQATQTLEAEHLLAIATEEYHNSRGLQKDKIAVGDDVLAEPGGGSPPTDLPQEKDLSPEIRKEVRQVTQRLIASLSTNGQADVNPQQVHEWALQVTLRRHKLGDFLEEPSMKDTSLDLSEMQKAAANLEKTNVAAAAYLNSLAISTMSSEDFERDLEGNVRKLLLNATASLIEDVVSSLPGKIWQDEQGSASMKSALISEFAPTADIIMEAIVSKDYKKWLQTLKIEGGGTAKHKEQFTKLHGEFQQVLNSEISATVVQQICSSVVTSDELYDIVRGRASQLSKLGRQKKLDEPSSDEEELKDLDDAW